MDTEKSTKNVMGSKRQRASAIILQDNKILLIRRIKPGHDYYIFPGGGVDDGESIGQSIGREVMIGDNKSDSELLSEIRAASQLRDSQEPASVSGVIPSPSLH